MFDELMNELARGNGSPPMVSASPPSPAVQPVADGGGPDIVVTARPKAQPTTQTAMSGALQIGKPTAPGFAGHDMNMFTDAPRQVNEGIADVKDSSSNLNDVFASVAAGLKANSDQKLSTATAAVAAKKQLNDNITATNQRLLGEVAPLFATREALADRRAQLSNMNPIKKAIFGIFDRNYSEESIQHREEAVNDQLATRGQEFEQQNQLVGHLLSAVSGNAEGAMSLLDIKGENLNQDLQLADMRLHYARAGLDDTLKAVGAKTEVTRAQMLLTDKTISELDQTGINAGIAAAQKNGGRVMINGAEMTTQQLRDRQIALQRQDLGLTAAKQEVTSGALRIKSQKMGLAQQGEQLTIDHMSYNDTLAAVNNGGMYRGHQLNLAALGSRMAQLNNGVDAAVEANSGGNNIRVTAQAVGILGNRGAQMIRQANQLYGGRPPAAIMNLITGITSTVQNAGRVINGANGPTTAKTISSLLPGIQGQLDNLDKTLDKVAQGMTRDPDAQIAIGSYLKGNQMTAQQAVRSVIAFSSGGGMPPGVKLGGPVAAAMAAGQKTMAQVMQSDSYKRADKDGKQRLLETAVSGSISKVWTGQNVQRINMQLPDLAKQLGDPFASRINRDQFEAAHVAGDNQGLAHATTEFNTKYGASLKPDEFKSMFGGNQQILAAVNKGKQPGQQVTGEIVQQLASRVAAYQTSAWMQNLDQIGGSGTSRMFAQFLRRDDVQGHIGNFADSLGRSGFGEMLAESTSPGGVRGSFANAANMMMNQVAQNHAAQLQSTRERIAQYHDDPGSRAGVILGNIEGLSQHDRAIAEATIQKAIQAAGGGNTHDVLAGGMGYQGDAGVSRSAYTDAQNSAMEIAIKGTRYKDPALSRIMSHVAQNWEAAAGGADRVMSRLAKGSH